MEKEEKRADQENDTEEQSTEAKSLLKKKLQYYSCLLYTSETSKYPEEKKENSILQVAASERGRA